MSGTFEIIDAVSLGATLLDRDEPGWAFAINTDTLRLDDPFTCILGQLFGDYQAGGEELKLWRFEDRKRHGFTTELDDEEPTRVRLMRAAWLVEIAQRIR